MMSSNVGASQLKKWFFAAGALLCLICVCLVCYPQQSSVAGKSLQLPPPDGKISIFPNPASGAIAYLSPSYSGSQGADLAFNLVVYQTNQPTQSQKVEHRFVSNPACYAIGCDFSPDGKNVLVKLSAPSVPTDVYNILVWHRSTRQVQQGPQGLRYVTTYWSPNSKYLAYLQGGDVVGQEVLAQGDENQDAPVRLSVFDTTTGARQVVVQHPVLNSIAWMSPDVLLYSTTVQPMPLLFVQPQLIEQPNIYSYSVSARSSTKLITNGFNPAASPDAKNIAYIGWLATPPPPPSQAKQKQLAKIAAPLPSAFGVYVYNIQTKTKSLVYPIKSPAERDQLLWTPDNKHLLLLRVLYRDTSPGYIDTAHPADYPGYGEGHFVLVNTSSRETRELAVVKTVDAKARTNPATLFQLKGFAETGKSLFFLTSEATKEINQQTEMPNTYDRLRQLDLNDGSLQDVYAGTNLTSLGWHE